MSQSGIVGIAALIYLNSIIQGYDKGFQNWQNGQDRTLVSFIPTGSIWGYNVREYTNEKKISPYFLVHEPVINILDYYDVFHFYKNFSSVRAPFIERISEMQCVPMDSTTEFINNIITQYWSQDPLVIGVLDLIMFKRDYLPDDLFDITYWGIASIEYTIKLHVSKP